MGRYLPALLVTALLTVGGAGTALALTSQSPNFEISEPEFGAGAALETCSGQYCARASIGDISPGEVTRSASTASFDSLTTDSEPLLEVIIEPGQSNLGVLDTEQTAYSQSVIKVRTYLSDGYTLQVAGGAPRYQHHTLQSPTEPTVSTPGTEQFGINLVANTTPEIGANPVQVPSGEFSFGYVTADYDTPNQFMYQADDVVARSDSESGQTEYTVSMIINVSNQTPAGHFTTDFSAIVIPVF